MKFEEDILPPFRSVFSQSNSLWFDKLPKLKDFADLAKLFPGLAALDAPAKMDLQTVNGFVAHEVFHKLCKLGFGKNREIKVGLSFWYNAPDDRWPLIAECAFDYCTDQRDDFPTRLVRNANRLFQGLQNQPGWFDLNATTKTQYAYRGFA